MRTMLPGICASLLLGGSAFASGHAPTMRSLDPHGSTATVAGYTIDLGEPDDPKSPRAWQGPIRITQAGKTGCTVSDDVAIVEKPLKLMADHLLYVTTYSGSESKLYVVDAKDCSVRWTSSSFIGRPSIGSTALTLPGADRLRIDPDGMPGK